MSSGNRGLTEKKLQVIVTVPQQTGVSIVAYMNQEKKAKIAPTIKEILKRYGVKGSLRVRNHSSLVLTVRSGTIDFNRDYGVPQGRAERQIQVNPYHYQSHFTGTALQFLSEVIPAMNSGNHDNSNAQIDYFDVGWYTDVNIGDWDKPYQLT